MECAYDLNHISRGFTLSLPSDLSALLPSRLHVSCEMHTVEAGQLVFRTGEVPRWMFFVSEGEVLLERHGLQGQVVCLQRCHRGFVGEASLTSSQYHCDGRVSVRSAMTRVPLALMREGLSDDPAFADRWIRMLSSEVRRLRLQNERLSMPKLEDRVLHLLDTEGKSGYYPLRGSIKGLSRQLGVSHEALYRCLSKLQASGRLHRSAEGLQTVL